MCISVLHTIIPDNYKCSALGGPARIHNLLQTLIKIFCERQEKNKAVVRWLRRWTADRKSASSNPSAATAGLLSQAPNPQLRGCRNEINVGCFRISALAKRSKRKQKISKNILGANRPHIRPALLIPTDRINRFTNFSFRALIQTDLFLAACTLTDLRSVILERRDTLLTKALRQI